MENRISALVVPPLSPKQIEAIPSTYEDAMHLLYEMCLLAFVNRFCAEVNCQRCLYYNRNFSTFKIVARKHFLKGETDEHI